MSDKKKIIIEDTEEHKKEKEYLYALLSVQFIPILDYIKKSNQAADKKIQDLFYKVDQLMESIDTASASLKIPEGLMNLPDEYSDLALFIRGELLLMINAGEIPEELEDIDPTDLLLLGFKAEDGPAKAAFDVAFQRAQRRAKRYFIESCDGQSANAIEDVTFENEIEKLTTSPVLSIYYPIDKVNFTLWSLIDSQWNDGKTYLEVDTATEKEKRKDKHAIIDVSIDLEGALSQVHVDIKLDEFDKRVFIAYCALTESGNRGFSASQIYTAMGQIGTPSAEDIKKINDSLTKMRAGTFMLNNERETELHRNTPKYSIFDSSFLPFVRERKYINNTICEDTIIPLIEAPLFTFSKKRGQIIPVSTAVLQSPINKTKSNLAIEHYLLYRIGRMKNKESKANKKILYSTLFERCHITDRRYKARAKNTVHRYLDSYKKTGFIRGYETAEDGITVKVN